jgi:hypothetical protein
VSTGRRLAALAAATVLAALDAVLREVTDRLEVDLPRVAADLGVSGVRTLTVKVWQDEPSWSAEVLYDVGYVIGEFVVARGGLAALRELIRTNGDTAAVLGLSAADFEAAWYGFVRERYLS